MNTMEDLTKTQMVLLTLLVSFVTSIATGIITVSLLAEAPASVIQTINRVVEHTIEKVAPTNTAPSTNVPVVKEVTVVKEEDAIINAIDKSTQAIVRIKSPVNQDGSQNFYALGVMVTKDGFVLSDKRIINMNGTYTITLPDGSSLPAVIMQTSDGDRLTLFKITPDASHPSFIYLPLSKNELKLGQSVIAVEGKDKNSVGLGRILSINYRTEKDINNIDVKVAYSILTDINPDPEIQGGPLLNLSGELVGIKTSNDDLTVPNSVYTTLIPMRRMLEKAK